MPTAQPKRKRSPAPLFRRALRAKGSARKPQPRENHGTAEHRAFHYLYDDLLN